MKLLLDPNDSCSCSDVEPEGNEWRSTSIDPQFHFAGPEGIRRGWYRVSAEVECERSVHPIVYFNFGNGFNALEAAKLYPAGGNRFEGTIFLRAKPHHIRFDPLEERTRFKAGPLSLSPVNRARFGLFAAGKAARLFAQAPVGNLGRIVRAGMSLARGQHFVSIDPEVRPIASGDRYDAWRERFGFNPDRDGDGLRADLDRLPSPAGISVLMPVYNTPAKLLEEAILSVVGQIHTNWELCIANDASTARHIRPQLDQWATRDPRIKVVHRESNGHISRASNSALELVTKPWVALLDHDDVLAPHALAEVALAIDAHSDAEVFYSDEDKITTDGKRYDPHFKPEFSPELFRSMNYLNHLTVHRTENIRAVGGWRDKFVGSQDYDLNLRIWDHLGRDNVFRRIPKVLYHWRAVEGSTALANDEKDYTVGAALGALRDHVCRRRLNATAEKVAGLPFLRLRPGLPEPLPKVSFIIPTKDHAELVRNCVRSIYMQDDYPDFEILLVDNNSEDPVALDYFDLLDRRGVVRLLKYPYPFNYSAINNWAVAQSGGDIVALINNDIEAISKGWIREMAGWAWQDGVGCVGAKLLYPNETLQHAGVILGIGGVAGHSHKYFSADSHGYFARPQLHQTLSAVTAACLFVRRSTFDAVGGLDEEGLKVAFNDVDFCLKVREKGFRNVYTPFAVAYHYESISRGAEDDPVKVARFNSEVDTMLSRWGKHLPHDPYYSPNLTQRHENFAIRVEL